MRRCLSGWGGVGQSLGVLSVKVGVTVCFHYNPLEMGMEQGTLLYADRFLESYAVSIVTDPTTAIVELIANCWDAYSTSVQITWPDHKNHKQFKIADDGQGMLRDEFRHIWRTIAYDRIASGGKFSNPPEGVQGQPRLVFGKNGKGRLASFCFSSEYQITSRKNGQEFVYRVYSTENNPLALEEISFKESGVEGHGTEIVGVGEISSIRITEETVRQIIGNRFLADPAFNVSLNGRKITFNDIPDSLSRTEVEVEGYGKIVILHIDAKKSDKTAKHYGIAWWVQNRIVGEQGWRTSDYELILDGRRSEAKRFTFIVMADYLNAQDAVLSDWSGFLEGSEAWLKTRDAAQKAIRKIIFDSNKEDREGRKGAVMYKMGAAINTLSPVGKERVEDFVNEVVDSCPNFGEKEIVQLSSILVKLEKSKSRYGLLELLHDCSPDDYDDLHDILKEWTVSMAKLVLDEIKTRLKLIGELRIKLKKVGVDEVHELQPLFERGLWMFGAQFDSIEYTSNKGMTTVIKTLFKDEFGKGSRNRPDFVVLPDSSVGFYARASYNEDFDEDGVEHLVVIDLKTTGLLLGDKEKDQVWKYVKELREKGYLKPYNRVDGFVLGDKINPQEGAPTVQGEGGVIKITPLLYDTILNRAEKRLLGLLERVKGAPFLTEQQEALRKFLELVDIIQPDLTVADPANV